MRTTKKSFDKTTSKKPKVRSKSSIGMIRRIRNFTAKTWLVLKILAIILIGIFIATDKFDFITISVKEKIIEYSQSVGFNVENIVIEGKKHLQTEDVLDSIALEDQTAILSLDLEEIKVNLEENPWVMQAVIERKLPNTIIIGLKERTPIAIWQRGKDYFLVDTEGVLIDIEDIEEFSHLMLIMGKDANIFARKLIDDLNASPELAKHILFATMLGKRRWDLRFEGGLTVKMPQYDFSKAYDYLIKMHQNNRLLNHNLKIIDLRDSHKYYIEKY